MDAAQQAIQQLMGHLDPSNTQTPILGPIRKFNRDTFGVPRYLDPSIPQEERDMELALSFTPMGTTGVSQRMVNRAGHQLKGKITPGDREVIGKFAEMVETGRGSEELGEVGQTVQSLVDDLFGRDIGANLSNWEVKEALDMALKRAMSTR